jgi:G3E family GTPase
MTVSALTATSPPRLPVTIITGFLGSGKTTLVNHILANHHGARIGVIVNDLSEVNIDAELIVRTDAAIVELTNGCICCSLNGDFIEAVFRIIGHDRAPDYLVVETSGVSDPMPLALTFLRSELRDRVRLDSVITVADAENFAPARFASEAVRNQFAYGDVVVLNKCDRVDNARLDVIEQAIVAAAPPARIIRAVHCQVPLALILSVGLFAPERFFESRKFDKGNGSGDSHGHLVSDGFESLSFCADQALAVHKFQEFLETLPDNVYRGKGLLWIAENDSHYVFHLIAGRFTLDARAPNARKGNKLVLIGRNLDHVRLKQRLDDCLIQQPVGAH